MAEVYKIFLLFLLMACNQTESQVGTPAIKKQTATPLENKAYKVIGVKDGDTFVLLVNGKEQVVRFAHIDCPEKKQPFGTKAKQFVSDACFGTFVTLVHNNKYDRNKRLIAEVLLADGRNLNKELVKNGLAWHYKKYSADTAYASLETTARQQKAGLWIENTAVPPWQWRGK